MGPDSGNAQQRQIREARESLCQAESELETLLKALDTGDRADKKMISDVLREAFEKLSKARANLNSVLGEPEAKCR